MHIKKALAAYRAQKSNASRRGIKFLLTFKEWCDWWGEDIDRRGVGPDKLQMQRYGDKGPYALGNIKKGYPKDNSKTYSLNCDTKRSECAAKEREAALDAQMHAESDLNEIVDEPTDDEIFYRKMGFGSPTYLFGSFKADK